MVPGAADESVPRRHCGCLRGRADGIGEPVVSAHVSVRPEMLRWACRRARVEPAALAQRFPRFPAWERGERRPTLRQLEAFARATHTPVGYLFLSEPPEERVPIPDFRTVASKPAARPSANLLDAIYLCQQRQSRYREFALAEGEAPLEFVGAARLTDGIEAAAAAMRRALGFDIEERRLLPAWTDALRRFVEQIDAAGVLVMASGVVGNNNRRKLDPGEFRGFALADDRAPLIFVNGADTKAAQMFTLAHELAHIRLGRSALSDSEARAAPRHEVERWCNRAAAEFLAPLAAVREVHDPRAELRGELDRLARHFKVSTLVALRRIYDAGSLAGDAYGAAYRAELERLRSLPQGSGGNFYLTEGARVGKRFARAVIASTLEGRSSFSEAFRLLGFRKMATFRKLGESLGVSV